MRLMPSGLAPWILVASVAASAVAAAQDAGQPYVLAAGSSRVLDVGAFSRYVVLDPDRIAVEEEAPGQIRVTALQRTGLGVLYLFDDTGVRSLVFDVRMAAPPPPVVPEPVRPGPGETAHYASTGALGGSPSHFQAALAQDLAYHQGYGDTAVDARLVWALRSGWGWSFPVLRLAARHDGLAVGLGDTTLGGLSLPAPALRGAWAAWGHDRGPRVGVVAGTWRPTTGCCTVLDPATGGAAEVRGGYAWRDGIVEGGAGALDDPEGGGWSPLLHLDARYASGRWSAWAEAARIGGGFGAASQVALHAGPVDALANLRFVQRGYFLAPGFTQPGDTLGVGLAPAVRVAPRVRLHAEAGWTRSTGTDGIRRDAVSGSLGTYLSPRGPHSLSIGIGRQQQLGPEPRGVTNEVWVDHRYLVVDHVRVFDHAELELDEAFAPRAVRLYQDTRVEEPDGWRWGLSGTAHLLAPALAGTVLLLGQVGRATRVLDLVVQAGTTVRFGAGRVRAQPAEGLDLTWRPHPAHSVHLEAALVGPSPSIESWSVLARYTFTLSHVATHALALRGAVEGRVFRDVDRDGADDGDPGVEGVAVRLDDGDPVAWTDAEGHFRVRRVLAGRHEVRVDAPGYEATLGNHRPVEVQPLETASTSLPLIPGGHLVVHVFLDADEDGVRGPNDPGWSQGVVEVTGPDGAVRHGPRGKARIELDGLAPGTYAISMDARGLQPGLVPAAAPTVSLEAGERREVDLPLHAERALGGRVVVDADCDGRPTDRDPPAAGVEVELTPGAQMRTDADGRFLFRDLPAGAHTLHVPGAAPRTVDLSPWPDQRLDLEVLVPGDCR